MGSGLGNWLAIIGMALATYATRASGLYFMRGVTVSGRLKAALDALPPAILMAVIAPTVLAAGIAETLAAVVTAAAAVLRLPMVATIVPLAVHLEPIGAVLRLPMVATIVIGVVSVIVLRRLIG